MKPFNEQFKINNNELSSNSKEFSNSSKEEENKSVDSINKEIIDIKDNNISTSAQKLERTNDLIQSLKQQEIIWQTLSLEEKEAYKQLNPRERKEYLKLNSEERKKYLNLNPEERDFYLKHPKFRDKLLEGKIKLFELTIGERSKEQIQKELDERKQIKDYDNPKQISNDVQWMLDHEDFKISKEKKDIKLIKLSVADLGFLGVGASFKEMVDKGKEMGLDICPVEVGPLFRLDYEKLMGHDQPKNGWVRIAMDTIVGSSNNHYVFSVGRNDDGVRYLGCDWADPNNRFRSDEDFLFFSK